MFSVSHNMGLQWCTCLWIKIDQRKCWRVVTRNGKQLPHVCLVGVSIGPESSIHLEMIIQDFDRILTKCTVPIIETIDYLTLQMMCISQNNRSWTLLTFCLIDGSVLGTSFSLSGKILIQSCWITLRRSGCSFVPNGSCRVPAQSRILRMSRSNWSRSVSY